MILQQLLADIRLGQYQIRPQSGVQTFDDGDRYMAGRKGGKRLPARLAKLTASEDRDAERSGDRKDSPSDMRDNVQNILYYGVMQIMIYIEKKPKLFIVQP